MPRMTRTHTAPLLSCHSPRRPATGHDPVEGVTADGMIVTAACRRRIAPEFQAVISRAVEHVSAIGQCHSLYVYGSVATGTARVGSSDVDFVTVGLSPATAARIGKDLSAEYASLCRGVDIGAAQLSDYDGPGDEAYGNRVFLRHYCVHLAGPDVGHDLCDFAADKAAARGFNGDIELCADRWRTGSSEIRTRSFSDDASLERITPGLPRRRGRERGSRPDRRGRGKPDRT